METLEIPKEHQEIFEFYVELPTELKSKLIAEIKQSEMGLTFETLIAHIATKVPLPLERAKDIFNILLSLLHAQKDLALNNQEFETVLTQTFAQMGNLLFPPEKVAKEMMELMAVSDKNVTASEKIIEIVSDNPNVFLDITLNNDIRPIFLASNDNLTGLMIIHKLKIAYQENGERQEIHFSLDANDLKKLKEKIKLAEKQAEKLKTLINQPFFEIK